MEDPNTNSDTRKGRKWKQKENKKHPYKKGRKRLVCKK